MHIGTICIQIVPMCTRNGACTWVRAGQPSSDQSGVVKPKAVYVRGLKAKADQFLRKHVRLCLRPRGKVAPKHALSDSMNGFCGIGLTNVRTAQKGKRDPFDCKQSLVLGGITATQGQGRHIARQRAGGRVTPAAPRSPRRAPRRNRSKERLSRSRDRTQRRPRRG